MGLRVGRALRSRNFRLYFFGQGVSLLGTWVARFATTWMVFRLTHSGWMLGLAGFIGTAPSALLSPLAGVLVDRWNRHHVIIATQIAAMLQSAALAYFALHGTMTVWLLMLLGGVQAVINAFDQPARQAFVGQLLADKGDLPNAIALNSSMMNATRMIGPVIAAGLVHWVGEGWCWAIDAATYLGVIGSLLAMRLAAPPPRTPKAVWSEMRDGWRYVASHRLVKTVLVMLVITMMLGSYTTLLPLLARESGTLGILLGAGGAGAMTGAIYLANRRSVAGIDAVIARCALGMGLGMLALRFTPSMWLMAPVLFVIGGCLIVQIAASNTLVYSAVAPDRLGRVMSLFSMVLFTGSPLGSLGMGALADRIGAINTFSVTGGVTLVATIFFAAALPDRNGR